MRIERGHASASSSRPRREPNLPGHHLDGGDGNDTLIDGAGIDAASYATSTGGASIDLDVWSRHLVERIEGESLGAPLSRPSDELVWGEASEGLEPLGKVVGGDEVGEVPPELVVGFIVGSA